MGKQTSILDDDNQYREEDTTVPESIDGKPEIGNVSHINYLKATNKPVRIVGEVNPKARELVIKDAAKSNLTQKQFVGKIIEEHYGI